jgi:hypothetical protein
MSPWDPWGAGRDRMPLKELRARLAAQTKVIRDELGDDAPAVLKKLDTLWSSIAHLITFRVPAGTRVTLCPRCPQCIIRVPNPMTHRLMPIEVPNIHVRFDAEDRPVATIMDLECRSHVTRCLAGTTLGACVC